jgi:hypothetical protein
MAQQAKDTLPEPIRDGLGASIWGPRNVPLERENPDLLMSPNTDSDTIPNLKFSFFNARNRLLTGGWAPARVAHPLTNRMETHDERRTGPDTRR